MTLTRLLTTTAITGLSLSIAPTALAQTEQQQDAEVSGTTLDPTNEPSAVPASEGVVITGSRIPRAGFDTPQPAIVVDSQTIEDRGYSTIADALREVPAFGPPGSSPIGGQAGSFGSGQNFANFFGLGSQRTLTLVNGRRFVSSNTSSIFGPAAAGSQVDLNVIPTRLVERVETIAIGGAPIYGADAIAGTVNIILRRDYEGIALDGQYGISERGDGRDYRLRALAGTNFADGRGNITLSGEYNESDGLLTSDRRVTAEGRFFTTPLGDSPFRNVLIFDRRIPALSATGAPTVTDFFPLSPGQAAGFGFQPSVTTAGGQPLVFDANGNLVPLDFGQRTGNLINFSGGNGFSLVPLGNLLSPLRRYLGTALASYQFSDNIRLFGEGWYANSKGTELRAQPVYNTSLFDAAGTPDGSFIIPLSNPFLSPAARATIQQAIANNPASDVNSDVVANQDYFYLGRANTDLISGLGEATVELYRFVAGVDGSFDVGGRTISYEVVGNYGRSTTDGRSRELVQQNFLNALNATTDANGNIVCAPGAVNSPIQTVSSTCVPFNPFGQQNSQAVADYITTVARPRSVNTQRVVTASLQGEAFKLPAGNIGFALGYEHREEKARFDPGVFFFGAPDPTDPTGATRTSYGRSVPIDPVSGRFNTEEVFGELRVPVTSPALDIPALYRVELNGAVRYVDNSLAGGDFTYTAGAEWQPIQDITLRGNYTRSIRGPAITELFNPSSGIFTTANDPCDSRFLGDGPDPVNRQANCAADGLPADFQSNIVDFTTRGSLSGNQNLENEKANSYTFGAVLRPRFLPGFTASADWVDIKLRNAIVTLGAEQTLNACYDATAFPAGICGQIDRDADGQVTFIRTGFFNAATRDYRGLIAELAYRLPMDRIEAGAALNLRGSYSYIDKSEQQVGTGDLTTIRGGIGDSKHQFNASGTYTNHYLSFLVQARYIGPAAIDPDAAENTYDFPRVGAFTTVNSSLSFEVAEQMTFRFIVDNVFDVDPPFPSPAGGGTTTYFPAIFGRSYRVGASVKF